MSEDKHMKCAIAESIDLLRYALDNLAVADTMGTVDLVNLHQAKIYCLRSTLNINSALESIDREINGQQEVVEEVDHLLDLNHHGQTHRWSPPMRRSMKSTKSMESTESTLPDWKRS